MNDHDDDAFDAALREQLHGSAEPDDAGFSLRVMAALPPSVAPHQRRLAQLIRWAQWAAASLAACGAATLIASRDAPLDVPHTVAAAALMGLLAFWLIPSRWSRG